MSSTPSGNVAGYELALDLNADPADGLGYV